MSHEYSGPQWSTLLTEKLLAAGIPTQGVGKDAEGAIVVSLDDTATPEQIELAQSLAEAFDEELEIAKVNQLATLKAQFEAAGAVGFDTGLGFKLRATTEDQTEFNKLQTSIALFTQAGFWNNDTEITILDSNLLPHNLTIAQWQALSLGYAGFCLQLVNQMGLARAAILTGETVQQVQSVSLT